MEKEFETLDLDDLQTVIDALEFAKNYEAVASRDPELTPDEREAARQTAEEYVKVWKKLVRPIENR